MGDIEKRISSKGVVSYKARVRKKGYPTATETFTLKADAIRWQQKIKVSMEQGTHFPEQHSRKHTVQEVIDLYVADLHLRNPRRYRDIDHILDWWKSQLGGRLLSSVTSEDILKCQHTLQQRKSRRRNASGELLNISPATVNRYVVALHTVFEFAVSPLKWLPHNPASDVKTLKEPPGRTRYLSMDEIPRVLTAALESKNKYLFAIVVLGIATGARLAEIQRMTWADVRPDCTAILLPITKNGEKRSLPITGIALAILQQMYGERGNNIMLFPSPTEPTRCVDFRHAWEKVLKRANVKDFHFHDLRHTCASYMAMNGATLLELASALGHKTLAMVKRYRNDLLHFRAWGGTIPATADTVAAYLSSYAGHLSIATMQRRIVSVAKAHTMQGYSDPTKSDLVKLTLRGIRRIHGKPQTQATPIMKDDLIVMLSHAPASMKGIRDQALLMLGFCGALRRSELVAIRAEDLQFTPQGILLTIPRSKTDQNGEGRKIAIPKSRGRICPVGSVGLWLEKSSIESGPIFRAVDKGGRLFGHKLSDRAVSDIVKQYTKLAGLDPKQYSGHSLRAGLATSAAQAGISSWKIMAQTGHRTEAMLARYVRDGDLFNQNAAALF